MQVYDNEKPEDINQAASPHPSSVPCISNIPYSLNHNPMIRDELCQTKFWPDIWTRLYSRIDRILSHITATLYVQYTKMLPGKFFISDHCALIHIGMLNNTNLTIQYE
jgi:hypothetical protein